MPCSTFPATSPTASRPPASAGCRISGCAPMPTRRGSSATGAPRIARRATTGATLPPSPWKIDRGALDSRHQPDVPFGGAWAGTRSGAGSGNISQQESAHTAGPEGKSMWSGWDRLAARAAPGAVDGWLGRLGSLVLGLTLAACVNTGQIANPTDAPAATIALESI